MVKRNRAYFIGDAHIGIPLKGCENRKKYLYLFLERIMADASHLFIMGDLFDFWIEYRYAIRPDYFQLLYRLKMLTEIGVEIHYMAGNHDFAMDKFFKKEAGIEVHSEEFSTEIQGKRLFMHHGDGMIKSDRGYRILKKILRSKVNQKLYKFIHPDIGIPLASFFSGMSRKYMYKNTDSGYLKKYIDVAFKHLDSGYDIVVFAHTHTPQLVYRDDGRLFCNPGEWLRSYTYSMLEDGKMTLFEYHPAEDKTIPAE